MKRRDLLAKGSLTALAFATGCHDKETTSPALTVPLNKSKTCIRTSSDMEGPYYPALLPERSKLFKNVGQRVSLSGTITNTRCQPFDKAIIQIWHANHLGEYDLSEGEREYTGQQTVRNGTYNFDTLLPGAYENGPNIYRPRHFHFKVLIAGRVALTTQLYFEGDDNLKFEPHLPDGRKIELEMNDNNSLVAQFNFVIA